MSKKIYWDRFYGVPIRTTKSYKNKEKKNGFILVFGDSISGGYGLAYQDIWWKQLEEFLKIKKEYYNFISISTYGSNQWDSINSGKNFIKKLEANNRKPNKFIYQFNFNDIHPYKHSDIKFDDDTVKEKEGIFKFIWFKFAKWRYSYLNKSVFFRVAQHYGGILKRKTSGSCEERKLDALGPYTWTFGSKTYKNESLNLWKNFEENIKDMNNFLKNRNIEFEIMVSPLLFHIDKLGYHKNYNHRKLDFNCSTINPLEKLQKLADNNNIILYNPIDFVHSKFMERVNDGNFEAFFHNADVNHFNEITSRYIAEFIANEWRN